MRRIDAAASLRIVAGLRTLCLGLPHAATPAELRRLARFHVLVGEPDAATETDIEALVAGWQSWWRGGEIDGIVGMGRRLPVELVERDRRLASFLCAARISRWRRIQKAVWDCAVCAGNPRVEMNLRQQTDVPMVPPKLLIVALAPPFAAVAERRAARSVTNNPEDPLRRFLEASLGSPWEILCARGLAVLHAVKCGIVPTPEGFQNPPREIVDACASNHLAAELGEVRRM